ncbi:hypothetical protein E1757_07420 [Paenibacillus piri]|uniref:Uncharacterized protein n=1 Tax=Paenibacillus piri TaxID=2547395 RepID=A0A4R5KUR0_9BACL|nr:hypothetical protein E1757_07420 [Paenibacillus piri]
MPDTHFVFCGDKSIIQADYLIDDTVNRFQRFVGQGILFTAQYNIHETGYVRVHNWQDVWRFFIQDGSGD